jgi:hypothetical protein
MRGQDHVDQDRHQGGLGRRRGGSPLDPEGGHALPQQDDQSGRDLERSTGEHVGAQALCPRLGQRHDGAFVYIQVQAHDDFAVGR